MTIPGALVVLAVAHLAVAVQIRRAPNASENLNAPINTTQRAGSFDLAAVLEHAAALGAGPPPQSSNHSQGNRSRLDIGVTKFENLYAEAVVAALSKRLPDTISEVERKNFGSTVRSEFTLRFGAAMKPTKQTVAKHWVELKDEKRDAFAEEIKMRFAELFRGQEYRFVNRTKVDFWDAKDFPPLADVAHIKAKVDKGVDARMKFLTKQLDDYVEMFYMSNIFLNYRIASTKRTAMLALQTSVQ